MSHLLVLNHLGCLGCTSLSTVALARHGEASWSLCLAALKALRQLLEALRQAKKNMENRDVDR